MGQFVIRPLSQPLFDTMVMPGKGEHFEMDFFSPMVHPRRLRQAGTRSVTKLIEQGIIADSTLLARCPDSFDIHPRPKMPVNIDEPHYGSVILGLNAKGVPQRFLVLCDSGRKDPGFGYLGLWSNGSRWGKRIKELQSNSINAAYDKIGPLACMAIAARWSSIPEISMAGNASKIPI